MKILIVSIFCFNLLLTSANHAENNGHCDKSKHMCDNEGTAMKRYLFYDVNPPEGFNLRRDVYMRFAIMLVERMKRGKAGDWHLVLPPWHNIYHWRTDQNIEPKPWNMFFDLVSLRNYAPVLELFELMTQSGRYGLNIDNLYVLQNFENAFENGVFEDKWNVVGPCKYDGRFWGYQSVTAKRVTCIQFQGSISKLWEIVDLHPEDKKVMFAYGEIPLHDSYGTKSYWDCRKSMVPNQNLVLAADRFIVKELECVELKCSNYIAIHWRRRDFVYSNRGTSVRNTATQINDIIKKKSLSFTNVFIATDGSIGELEKLLKELISIGLIGHAYLANTKKFSDGQLAIIDQIICARAAFFIGTLDSTFTYRIQEEREILRHDSNTTFNAFCPDVGKCQKPSIWRIVD